MRRVLMYITVLMSFSGVAQTLVYICTGPKSLVFHRNTLCLGLQECRSSIIPVLRSEAKTAYRRRHCYLCYTLKPKKKST